MRIARQLIFSPSNRWTLPGLIFANSDDAVDRQQGREAADGRGQRAEHAKLRAIVAILGIEGIADKAAIAGLRAEQPDLALELDRGGGNERHAETDAGVADGQAGREIVASVDHQVMTGEQSRAHCPGRRAHAPARTSTK